VLSEMLQKCVHVWLLVDGILKLQVHEFVATDSILKAQVCEYVATDSILNTLCLGLLLLLDSSQPLLFTKFFELPSIFVCLCWLSIQLPVAGLS
jgi:hypothetical protein